MPFEPIALPIAVFTGLVVSPSTGTLDALPAPATLTTILIAPAAVTFNALDAVLSTISVVPAEVTFDALP